MDFCDESLEQCLAAEDYARARANKAQNAKERRQWMEIAAEWHEAAGVKRSLVANRGSASHRPHEAGELPPFTVIARAAGQDEAVTLARTVNASVAERIVRASALYLRDTEIVVMHRGHVVFKKHPLK